MIMKWATAISVAAMSLAATAPADDLLLRPISPEYAKRWLAPQVPTRLFGNTYLVGFGGLTVAVIRTDAGLILIDGAVPQAVPQIEANLRKVGLSIRDVKLILSTEPHWDHAGGLAALARDSGATVLAGAQAAPVLRNGGRDAADPQAADLATFPAVKTVRAVRDGERIRLGNVTVTAVATPGHTEGSTSWQWQACEGKACATVLFASSLNPISSDSWRFSDHPERVSMFRRTFARFRQLPCDILLSAHPDQSGGDRKLAALRAGARPNPFRDPAACKAYADKHEALLDKRLREEAGR
ncbi:subclass B3 metallo-beta-lactamase [Novosphingobium sp. 9U]|uniref:subclass B3 metallo-beta-lactamase n=1 Tax=Novosphingobium sp. 9U TaxID=2653158 RepID=UPI0012F22ACF|nr:subclass B3 metallo-beta-lactamase [Novosphingobium sp. 9U]VWX52890.1 Putative metallo-beta-lactamase [Novosphingobium sp. 9U]